MQDHNNILKIEFKPKWYGKSCQVNNTHSFIIQIWRWDSFGRGKGVEGNYHFQVNISKEKLQKNHKTTKISAIFSAWHSCKKTSK